MKRNLYVIAALGAAMAMTGCGKKVGPFSSDYFSTNPNPLEVVGEQVPATVTGRIPAKFFVKNAEVTVTPYLVYNGTETASTAYTFQGEKVRGNAPVVSYANGGVVTIPVNYAYTPAMASSELQLAFEVKQGKKQYVLPRVTVGKGVLATAYLAKAGNVAPAIAPDAFQRIINEKYAADIMFLINQANIRAAQLNTDAMSELWNAINTASQADNRRINEINIQSYASPDGTYEYNSELAQKRENTTGAYLDKQLKKDNITEFGELTRNFTAEDWEGFAKLVAQSNIQDKDLILSVLSMYKDPEEREREIRNLSVVFNQLAEQILPQLRYSRITASIDVIGKSDEEIAALAVNSPKDLTVEEILYAGALEQNPAKRAAIYQNAANAYPTDYRTWNDLGLAQYVNGDFAAAAKSFGKAASLNPKAAEPAMNLGLIELVNGNYEAANKKFGAAAGLKELGAALGTYYLKKGDNNAAVRAFGDAKSNNAALAQILTKDYSKAKQTLAAVANPDATTYYIAAILGARTNNATMLADNLRKAVSMNPALATQALTDLEFANFNIANIVK